MRRKLSNTIDSWAFVPEILLMQGHSESNVLSQNVGNAGSYLARFRPKAYLGGSVRQWRIRIHFPRQRQSPQARFC